MDFPLTHGVWDEAIKHVLRCDLVQVFPPIRDTRIVDQQLQGESVGRMSYVQAVRCVV